jgi:hypothetical protein
MDNSVIFKKVICFIKGHKNLTSKCPFTGIEHTVCLRCAPKHPKTEMSFN